MTRRSIAFSFVAVLAACGGNNETNNDHHNHDHGTNNGATNNGATNNGATNNGATNNGATNNGATNNGATNNGTIGNETPLTLTFRAQVNGGDFACDGDYTLGSADTAVTISDIKFHVSNVALVTADGTELPVTLDSDGMWQNGEVALLDFEDGTGACLNGTTPTRNVLTGVYSGEPAVGVRFTVGVPFELNHQDVATAAAPLNLASMFWNWQGGYKFLRIDGLADGSAGWRVHVGSTGCEMDENMVVTGCANGNRIEVALDDHDPAEPIVLDIDALLADVDMTPNADDASAVCMSAPDHAVCAQIFPHMGLPFMGQGGDTPQDIFK